MEVLPCSDVQGAKQLENSGGIMDALPLKMDEFPEEKHDELERTGNGSLNSESSDLNAQNHSTLPCLNSDVVVDTTDTRPPDNSVEGELSPEPKWLQQDEPVALWVKWRGKWQAGIRCARADWPLGTLRGKPTHDRKKYFVVFFPHTKNYSWADMQLVRSINEYPEPTVYKSHKAGLKMVKDLTAARRYIMRKLAVGMLNIVDQFHSEVVVDTARDVMIWKEFAMEASRSAGYHDLGRMLLKLQSMILQCYMNPVWLESLFPSWVQRCNSALNAESIELLKEELDNSIKWNEVKSSLDASMQLTLLSEWKMWKHEVTKWFSISPSSCSGGKIEQQNSENLFNVDVQASRKRPKLEIRRAETHASQVEPNSSRQGVTVEIDSEFFSCQDRANTAELAKETPFVEEDASVNTLKNGLDQWDGIVVEPGGLQLMGTKEANESVDLHLRNQDMGSSTHNNESSAKKPFGSGNKSQQCIAFIESKGRQCVRWANEGDVYCCVHLASRFTAKPTKTEVSPAVETPMCSGITVLGTKCKHRSLPGSLFCKKHRQTGLEKPVCSSSHTVKRKLEEIMSIPDTTHCQDIVPLRETEVPSQSDIFSGRCVSNGTTSFTKMLEHCSKDSNVCVGSCSEDNYTPCHETSTRHTLYCDQHLPNWLKRARNGKSRIISKEVFLDLLRACSSREEKLQLHQACDLFYKLFKSVLSLRNSVPMDIQLQWAISEASKDASIGEFLLKLVCREKERLMRIWGFTAGEDAFLSFSTIAESATLPLAITDGHDGDKIETKEEDKWKFRGFACAICLDSFMDRKLLETHVEERHHVQFAEKCMLLQCIPCGSHFGDSEQLLLHVQSVHPSEFKLPNIAPQEKNLVLHENSSQQPESGNSNPAASQKPENSSGVQKYICKFCGLKFDLLPDLGRHHQAEHMGTNLPGSRGPKRGVRFYAYRMKSGRLSRPNRFKKGLGAASYRIRNRANISMKKRMQTSKSLSTEGLTGIPAPTDAGILGRLTDSHCSVVAKILFSKVQKTKPRPNNLDILSAARSACCKLSLKASLEAKFGILPERIYLKAAKLCSEHGVQVQWHCKEFLCPHGCKYFKDPSLLSPLAPRKVSDGVRLSMDSGDCMNNEWEVDECHCIMESHHFDQRASRKATVLCNDISLGQESVPLPCVVDEDLLDSDVQNERPWVGFTYITKPILDESMDLEKENLQLGCGCRSSACSSGTCDHVYLFDNDFEDAKDIFGKSMQCRFPYDDRGRIILEEGYPVYECNDVCGCSKTCRNRVLQNGIHAKLEVFRTERKGWGLRACEPILRGTFICEYIGEVLEEQEANKRRNRYGKERCSYMYNVDARINDIGRLIEGEPDFVIDSTMYGNVSRFINHSCLPNLVTHQVLVESMESPRAHIGLYASSDIAAGEELTCDYRRQLMMSGQEQPCFCGASNCRGRLC